MAKLQLVHILPDRLMHGLNGYREVIETVQWGLKKLGHTVSRSTNTFARDAVNIVFGAQMMSVEALRALPDDTIVYNFEQMRGVAPETLRPSIGFCAAHFRIWEYSEANLAMWQALSPRHAVVHVPVGYAPVLTRIAKAAVQDIDVLIYGMASEERLMAFQALSDVGLSVVFVSGLYGPGRDGLIGRAKLVLNLNRLRDSRIFEVVRTSYLLANKKAVISDRDAGTFIEADMLDAVQFVDMRQVVAACQALVADDAARQALERRGFEVIRRRDVVGFLKGAGF